MAQRAFLGQLRELQEKLDKVQPIALTKVAQTLVRLSPDDTGAYVLSHSIGRSGNVGRRISSHGRPSAPNTHREQALAGLMNQIATIPPNSTRVWIGNNAPHVNAVEFGLPTWSRSGYAVYNQLRAIFPSLIKQAIREAGLK